MIKWFLVLFFTFIIITNPALSLAKTTHAASSVLKGTPDGACPFTIANGPQQSRSFTVLGYQSEDCYSACIQGGGSHYQLENTSASGLISGS